LKYFLAKKSFAKIMIDYSARRVFLAILSQETFLGQFLAMLWFLLLGRRHWLAGVAGS
jgi:hypothetical protein